MKKYSRMLFRVFCVFCGELLLGTPSNAQTAASLKQQVQAAVAQFDAGHRDEAMRGFHALIKAYNERASLSAEDVTAVGIAATYLGQDDPQLFKDALRAFGEASRKDPKNPEAHLLAGELLLDKYNSTEAAAEFQDALRIAPNNARALLGMARVADFDHDDKAIKLAEESLKADPNQVGAHVLLARLHVQAEEYAPAAREAEAALKVDARSLDALSALAAVRFLEGNRAAYDTLRARILGQNPRYADLYVTLADMSAMQRKYSVAVDLARQAVKLDPKSWPALGLLGMNLLRVGQIDSARTALEASFKGDPYNVWNKNTLDLLDTFSRYRTTKTPRFEVMLNSSEADVLAPYFVSLANEAYDTLSKRYGYKPDSPVRLEVYPSHADFSVRTLGLPGLGALGVTFGKLIAMDSPSAREKGVFTWGSTLWHELTHVVTLGLGNQLLPRWFAEGLAVFEERHSRAGWGAHVEAGFLSAYAHDKLLPFSKLNNGFVRPAYPEQVIHSYYEASLVCDMIARDRGFPTLVAMIKAFGTGKNTEEVLRTVLDTDMATFDRTFDTYMRERFRVPLASIAGGGTRNIGVATPDSSDFLGLLRAGHLLVEAGKDAEAAPLLERAQKIFPEYASSDSPYALLAKIYTKRGERKRALAEMLAMTEQAESDYATLLEQADLQESVGDVPGAAASLERAIFVYPFDPAIHKQLADHFEKLGQTAKVIRERAAIVALNPVDRAEAIYQLALAYQRAGDAASAKRQVLQALELAPSFERAQDLLLTLSTTGKDRP